MRLSVFVLFVFILTGSALAQNATQVPEPQWQTWNTLAEPSKYGDNFRHYDYVNPDAPKGGRLNLAATGSFDSFNPYIIGGNPPAGLQPFGGGLLYDTLTDQSMDQGSVAYANLAEAEMAANDQSWVKYRLNPKAHWHDGMPITVEDVIWSFETLRKISPYYRPYYEAVDRVEVSGDREVTFFFKAKGNRELPKIVGDLVILPKHWWEGTDPQGNKRDITKPTLEIPLGSGAYKIVGFNPGKTIVWKRVDDYWGKNLPQNVGRNNFDEIRYSYLLDANSQWEAFKKGGIVDFRAENQIQRWVQDYTFPAVKRGAVLQKSFKAINGTYQAYFMNTRLKKFADIRTRKALFLALDFYNINRALYFDRYQRTMSYYGNQDISARGVPTGRELEILNEYRKTLPVEVFEQTFSAPDYSDKIKDRENLNQAMALLKEAGWQLQGGRLVDAQGHPFDIEILLPSPALERPAAFFIFNLKRLGISATMRTVDASQYLNRRNTFDFDIIVEAILQSNSPGNEQFDYFGSQSADIVGSRNYAGIKNPVVDKLITHLIHAQSREEVVATSRAIDRVLLWGYYSLPQWTIGTQNVAYWDKFGMPPMQPEYRGFDFLSWWIDPQKAAALLKK